jgi:hypothetical protein
LRQTLSACIIAFEEEERLPGCLASVAFCDEIVVVDSGSRDRTREIARAAGATVVENPWPGFAAQRNIALDRASGDWVLEVDADERVDARLAESIGAFLATPPQERAAVLSMREIFLGGELGPSSRYPRYRMRLFRRDAYRHDESRTVHEGLWPDSPMATLEGDLRHELAGSLGEALRDAAAYARLEAAQRPRPDGREAVLGILVRPLVKFAYRVLPYGGWRDGWRGLLKIGLECGADSLTTIHRLGAPTTGGAGGGFGQSPPLLGSVRLVGVAMGARGARRVEPWLREAAAAGADVALIAPGEAGPGGVRRRSLNGGLPALLRALDAEEQLRQVDALVLSGARERLLLRAAPGALRGATPPLSPADDPRAAVAAVQAATRMQKES